jgi:NAD(P)H-hydrate repair Nnr-like enzyme with NAD(P)H-hydrate dehydratase domain
MPPSPRADLREALRAHPLPAIDRAEKSGRGTTLVVGGSAQTPGAVVLAGRAALRAGAGRLRIVTDPSIAAVTAVAVPEARVGSWDDLAEFADGVEALVLGPGLLPADDPGRLLATVVDVHRPGRIVVLDALAIAVLLEDERACGVLATALVLTPNRSELRQLGGGDEGGDVADGAWTWRGGSAPPWSRSTSSPRPTGACGRTRSR